MTRAARFALVGAAMLVAASAPRAQQAAPPPTYIPQTQFDSGQDVVPVYEGWIRNSDGTFDFVFRYFNRNFKQELSIPAGPNNIIEPDGPDRGQPTYFLPRHESRIFRVRVPKDWGQKALTWSITANGRTEKAFADLRAVEEINESIMESGNNALPFEPGNASPNTAPTIAIPASLSASLTSPLTLTAKVTDDGLPKPRAEVAAPRPAVPGAQTNGATSAPRVRSGLTVRWLEYVGPAKVTFAPAGPARVDNGVASSTAQFSAAGTYKLLAIANDGQLSKRAIVTVLVK